MTTRDRVVAFLVEFLGGYETADVSDEETLESLGYYQDSIKSMLIDLETRLDATGLEGVSNSTTIGEIVRMVEEKLAEKGVV